MPWARRSEGVMPAALLQGAAELLSDLHSPITAYRRSGESRCYDEVVVFTESTTIVRQK